jgi:predicted transcriptional regulator
MEVQTEQRLTGRALREELREKYGDWEVLQAKAQAGDAEAADDLAQIALMEKEPTRLDHEYTITTIYRLKGQEILLTRPRLRMMEIVAKAAGAKRPLGVTELARKLKRDKKNVSEEVGKLEKMGFLRTKREGQRKLVFPLGKDRKSVV